LYIQNLQECEAVLKLASHLQKQQKEFQIITPYEDQRSTIEEQMKETPGLDWENKCFNVDSFQGLCGCYQAISYLTFYQEMKRTISLLVLCGLENWDFFPTYDEPM